MSFIKKYSILLIPVGIALVAVVFIVLTMMTSKSLAKDIQTGSVGPAGQISSLLSKPVPVKQAEVEEDYQTKHENDAKGVALLGRQASMRSLMRYDIFPEPTDTSQQLFDDYRKTFKDGIDGLLKSMNAVDAPDENDIKNEVGVVPTRAAPRARTMPSYSEGRGDYYDRTPTRRLAQQNQTQNSQKAMLEAVCSRRAEENLIYANLTAFKWYEYWENFKFVGRDSAIADCWYSQISYWIYEDVVETIAKMNIGSSNVYSSPVKRFIGVSFGEPVDYQKVRRGVSRVGGRGDYGRGDYGRGDYDDGEGGYGGAGDAPEYIFDKAGGVLGVEPWTARICDDDIDVVHFSVGVLTSASSVMPFMKELCSVKDHTYKSDGSEKTYSHNQITILKSEVLPVDREDSDHQYYRYGDDAVVRLDLICEYIFNRGGYDSIKPESIKESLGQSEESETSTTPGGAGRMPARSARPSSPYNR